MTVTNAKPTETTTSGPSTGFDIAALFSGAKPAPTGDQGQPNGDDAPQPESEITIGADEQPGGDPLETGAGEDETETVTVYQFGGTDYTEEQISEALKHSSTYERYNQSVAPVIDSIKQFTNQAAQFQAMAVTETDNQIKELTAALQSGQLNAQDYQLTHQALTNAQSRKVVLQNVADQVEAKRVQALSNARRQNAQQTATALVRMGWNQEQMQMAQGVAKGAMTMDQFADVVSPAFMEILRDAAQFRATRDAAAAKLKQQGQKVVKTQRKQTVADAPKGSNKPKPGDSAWMGKLWEKK